MASPRLLIDGTEIFEFSDISIINRANSEISTCAFVITNPDFQHSTFFNKSVEVFLNVDSIDTVPTFRGIIKEVTPSESNVSVTAYDPRIMLSSSDGVRLTLTDEYNYDGYTLSGFLKSVIEKYINTDDYSVIGLDFLNDTLPIIQIGDVRGNDIVPYDVIRDRLENFQRADTLDTPAADTWKEVPQGRFVLDIENDSNNAQLIFKELPMRDVGAALNTVHNFSYYDGIDSISYQRRPDYNVAAAAGTEIKFGDTAHRGRSVLSFKTRKEYPAEIGREARLRLMENQESNVEISMMINKGYSITPQSIIRISIDNDEIDGVYRVQSKTISCNVSNGALNCRLQLGRPPAKIADFLRNNF